MKLKAYHSILIFAILVMSAVFSSVNNYRKAQYAIVQDMNKALAQTLQENKYQWITPDTIQSYRSHLSIDLLKSTSNLCYVMEDRRRGRTNSQLVNSVNQLSSKEMLLNEHSIQSYANCSMADVFCMSNQRTPLTLTLMAMIWAIASLYYHRRKQPWNHEADMFGTDLYSMHPCRSATSWCRRNGWHYPYRSPRQLPPACHHPNRHLLGLQQLRELSEPRQAV